MRRRWMRVCLCLAGAGLIGALPAALPPAPAHSGTEGPLRLVRRIPLPGVAGRMDHMAADREGHRLFVAALGNNTLEVVDLKAGQRLKSLTGLQTPQGVQFLARPKLLFVANGDGPCQVFDAQLRPLRRVPLGSDADNVRYDAAAGRAYVGYGEGALASLDAATEARRGNVPLQGHPESFQLESSGPRIFVNVPSAQQIAVVDRKQERVVATWPVEGARANFPMALDEAHHRLLVGCRQPARLLVFDTTSGKEVGRADIAGDTDDLFYDAAHRRVYASCGAGSVDVLAQETPDRYRLAERIQTRPGARTSLFVAPDRLYLAVPMRRGEEAAIWEYSVGP